jgi:RNA polymerase sigma factor (sigma-70 family)
MVWGVCRRVLHYHHDAEDAFQATFLVLVRKAASVEPKEMVANWLYGVAHQTALKARSVAARRKERERQVVEMPEPAVEEQEVWHDLQPLLDQELSRLPDKYRVPLVLCDLEGKTRKEAARQLGWPEGTIAGRLATARKMLARRLARRGMALSAATLAAVLSHNAASACVPLAVVATTIQAATLLAAGQTAAGGLISVKVAALTEGVLKTMLLTKLKFASVLILAFALTAGCGTIILLPAPLARAQTKEKKEGISTRTGNEKEKTDDAREHKSTTLKLDGQAAFAAWSPDGKLMAKVKILDGQVAFAAWSPDGKLMATLSTRPEKEGKNTGFATLKLWDMQSGKLKHCFGETKLAHIMNARIGFSPDSATVAYCALIPSEDAPTKVAQELQLWDTQKGEVKRTIKMDYSGTVPTFAFSPNGKTLAVSWGTDAFGRLEAGARLFDTKTGEEHKVLKGHKSGIVSAVAFSPDGKWLATGGDENDQTIRLWDTQTAKAIQSFEGVTGGSHCLAFSPDSKLLASGGGEGVRLWEVRTGTAGQPLKNAGFVNAITFSPDRKLIATAGSVWKDTKAKGEVKVWDAKTSELLRTWNNTSGDSIAFTPDSQSLSVLLGDKQTVMLLRVSGEADR